MKKNLLLAGVACFLAISSANATDFQLKPYIGLDIAYTSADVSIDGLNSSVYENDFSSLNFNIGAKLHQNFGLEGYYQKSAKEEGKLATNVYMIDRIETSFDAYGIDVMGYLPVNDKLNAIGSIGLGRYEFTLKGFGDKLSESGAGYRFGLGGEYNFNEHFALRAMARYVILDLEYVDSITELSIGAKYIF